MITKKKKKKKMEREREKWRSVGLNILLHYSIQPFDWDNWEDNRLYFMYRSERGGGGVGGAVMTVMSAVPKQHEETAGCRS